MAQAKYTIYKYVRFKGGSWRYCRAALYANHTIKPDIVTVGGREEKHLEGGYYLACAGQWIPAGSDALKAQRQQHALLSGNSLEYERYSGRPVPTLALVSWPCVCRLGPAPTFGMPRARRPVREL